MGPDLDQHHWFTPIKTIEQYKGNNNEKNTTMFSKMHQL
jgi:hypothetical protein